MSDADSRRVFQQRLNQLLSESNMDQQELAAALGVSTSAVSTWTSGINIPRMDKIERIANLFCVSRSSLIEAQPATAPIPPGFERMPPMETVPLVGRIACGEPILAEQNIDDFVAVPAYWHAAFTLRCCGDSMEPTVHDGDLVAIRKETEIIDGQIYAVRIGDEARLKHVYRHPGQLILQSENPAYPPEAYTGPQLEEITIEGKAVGFCRNL